MFQWASRLITIRNGAALALGALVSMPLPAQAGPFAIFAPAQSIVERALYESSAVRAGGDQVQKRTNETARLDMPINIASALRPRSPNAEKRGHQQSVFGTVAISFRLLPALEKFAAAHKEMAQPSRMMCDGAECPRQHFRKLSDLAQLQDRSPLEKASAVNKYVNAHIAYKRDAENYGIVDYWATPQEVLSRRSGDCEDYAILKMALLRELGVADADMSIVVLRDERKNLFHAVLALRTSEEHLILDNMRDEIVVDSALPHYLPLYSISGGKGFIHGRRAGSAPMRVSSISVNDVAPGEGTDDVRPFVGN